MTRRKALAASAITATLCALVLGTVSSPAHAMTDAVGGTVRPIEYPSDIDVILAVGGQAIATSPPIPAPAKKMTFTIKTEKEQEAEAAVNMLVSLAVLSPRKRWATCAILAYNTNTVVQGLSTDGHPASALAFKQAARDKIDLCVQATLLLHSAGAITSPAQASTRAKQKCGMAMVTFPVSSSASGLTVTGAPIPTRSPLRVACRQSADTLTVTVKTKSKKATLAKVLGGPLPLGFTTPMTAPGPVSLSIGYRQPR